ncbi:MAG TPA: glycoside hydrolase family 2 TIM barrel-domain containing protein [Tepidisphaeraceae bacterium]|jgi:hypothetical protein|nr:glycoside hydrolase family 2 TIM barrel-domain containing protein [Tepidisphaeraceae bacterium]
MNQSKRISRTILTHAAWLAALAACGTADAAATKVELKKSGDNYQLIREGQPYFIEGAGGDASKPFLKECGGNSFRTWGAEDIDAKLDEAQKLGLTVTVGIWLGHERHGFDYNSVKQVREQKERARQAVMKYKDHPAVLMWAIGNEMEGYAEADNELIYEAVEDIAKMIKELDPNHPTMSVFAEVGGKRVPLFHKLCPSVDVMGINSYGGGPSIAERYRAAGGTKPFIMTEYGPAGTWEVGKNEWGAPQELTSTAKADQYRATYEKTILAEKDKLCLGGYAFTWGNKQEASATWFGLFMPDGSRLEATDTMTELWGGNKPANRCPQIKPVEVVGAARVEPGETIKAKVDVTDPEGDPLKIEWRLTKDYGEYQTGGDAQVSPPSFPDAIVKNGEREVELKMPTDGGAYWLYAVVHDDHNGAAVANTSLYVNGDAAKPAAAKANLPLVVYADSQPTVPYIPSGWMGNTDAIAMEERNTNNPHSGTTSMKFTYRASDNFGGVVWQSPANDWGDLPGGFNLTGAKRLSFWARGEEGGEKVEFKLGILKDKPFNDSSESGIAPVTLTKDWKEYEIDLTGKDLSTIKTGFVWTLAGQGKPVTFYLDDIRFE